MQKIRNNVETTKQCLRDIINGRRNLLTILSQERAALDKLASDVQNCKITGGVAGVVGSGMVIGGFVGAFFTFGAYLIVSAVGAGIAGSGAVVATGASIADSVISRKKRNLINNLLKEDAKLFDKFKECYETLRLSIHVLNLTKTVALTTKDIVTTVIRLTRIADVAVDASRTAFGVLRGAAKGFAIAGAVFSIVSLPIDIHTIVTNSIAKHKGNKHEISAELKQFEDDIRKELISMEAMLAEFENAERRINSI